MSGALAQPVKAESIVIGAAKAADGEYCVRVLMVAENGQRMLADLRPNSAAHLAQCALDAGKGRLPLQIIYPEM